MRKPVEAFRGSPAWGRFRDSLSKHRCLKVTLKQGWEAARGRGGQLERSAVSPWRWGGGAAAQRVLDEVGERQGVSQALHAVLEGCSGGRGPPPCLLVLLGSSSLSAGGSGLRSLFVRCSLSVYLGKMCLPPKNSPSLPQHTRATPE